jgi:hypothetical protein
MAATPLRPKKKPWKYGDPIPSGARAAVGLPEIPAPDKLGSKLPISQPPKAPRNTRDLFTDPEQRQAIIEYEVRRMRTAGYIGVVPSDIDVRRTSIDRNFTEGEHDAACWFIRVHAIVLGGRPELVLDLDMATKAEYAHVLEKLPEAYQVIFDWIAMVKYPKVFQRIDETLRGKVEVARHMFASTDEKYLRGGFDGYFKAACAFLAHVRAERQTLLDRRKLIHQEYTQRKKLR